MWGGTSSGVPERSPSSTGAERGLSGTGSAPTVDVADLCNYVLGSDASPGECGHIIGKVTGLARELEEVRRECGRLREEVEGLTLDLSEARRGGAEAERERDGAFQKADAQEARAEAAEHRARELGAELEAQAELLERLDGEAWIRLATIIQWRGLFLRMLALAVHQHAQGRGEAAEEWEGTP
ncbi:MAG: hypothetical protein ACJ8AT_06285 [Hyalangium sp.]|uniref:hypothetical protein n=1 Tax=Hyalangium sp. TaxID=2028555 RepID=UPI003899D632